MTIVRSRNLGSLKPTATLLLAALLYSTMSNGYFRLSAGDKVKHSALLVVSLEHFDLSLC